MAAQTFSTHLRDSNGNVVADVFVEVSEGGIKLEGQAGVLGQFPFQRVLQVRGGRHQDKYTCTLPTTHPPNNAPSQQRTHAWMRVHAFLRKILCYHRKYDT